jgi:hypothetical protein
VNAGPASLSPPDNVAAYLERLEAAARRLNHSAGGSGPVVYLDDRADRIALVGERGWFVTLIERVERATKGSRLPRLQVIDGDEVRTVNLLDFIRENADDAATCEAVRALRVGERVALGGGAAPVVHVRRFS